MIAGYDNGMLLDDQKPSIRQRRRKESSRLRSAAVQNPNHTGTDDML